MHEGILDLSPSSLVMYELNTFSCSDKPILRLLRTKYVRQCGRWVASEVCVGIIVLYTWDSHVEYFNP